MVPRRLAGYTARTAGTAALAAALTLAACGGDQVRQEQPSDTTEAALAAQQVRLQYGASDIIAAGAFTWSAGPGMTYVLIDAQSTMDSLVMARADLWLVTDSAVMRIGRSDVMASTAQFGGWYFEDLTGDGLPDFFGYVADSAGVSYPVFLPGARGSLTEELAISAPGQSFAIEDSIPGVMRSSTNVVCALKLWVEGVDSASTGWRYLGLLPDGTLMPPRREPPVCDAPLQEPPGNE